MLYAIIPLSIIIVWFCVALLLNRLLFKPVRYNSDGSQDNALSQADENVTFASGKNSLEGYVFGKDNTKGLVIFSHGMGVTCDYYLPEAQYLAKQGYKVVLFNNTGYGQNNGSFKGFPQAVRDLTSVVEQMDDGKLPITLVGHSMGGYSVCTALNVVGKSVRGVVAYAGFNSEREILEDYSSKLPALPKWLLTKSISLVQRLYFGKDFALSAVNGLNACGVNALIFQGDKDDEVTMTGASIYAKREMVNSNVSFHLVEQEGMNTHMEIIRPTKGQVNQKLIDEVVRFLE